MLMMLLAVGLAVTPMAAVSAGAGVAPLTLPDTLSLDWLERETLARNPSLAAMRAAAASARARARVSGSLEQPMVEGMVAPRSWSDGGDGAWRIEATQGFAPFGQRGLERRADRAEADAAAGDAETARLDLLREVREAFFGLYRMARAIETNAEQSDLMRQFRRVALTRYSAGTSGEQDVLDADAELAMLTHQEASLRREHRALDARLNSLLHRPPSDTLSPPPRVLVLPMAPMRVGGGGPLSNEASIAQSPERRAADSRVAAQQARLSLAQRRRLPKVKLGAAWDRFMMEPNWRGQVIAGLELPLWPGGLGAAQDEARAELSKAESERDAKSDEVALRIEEARAEYEESHHEIEVLESQVIPTSERALTAARAGFESGRAGFLAVIVAARRRGDSRLELEAARVRAASGWAALRRALATDSIEPGSEAERRP
jgi:outer membrane protein TolC